MTTSVAVSTIGTSTSGNFCRKLEDLKMELSHDVSQAQQIHHQKQVQQIKRLAVHYSNQVNGLKNAWISRAESQEKGEQSVPGGEMDSSGGSGQHGSANSHQKSSASEGSKAAKMKQQEEFTLGTNVEEDKITPRGDNQGSNRCRKCQHLLQPMRLWETVISVEHALISTRTGISHHFSQAATPQVSEASVWCAAHPL